MIGVVIAQMVSISHSAVSLPSLCVKEASLDLMLVHLVAEDHLPESSVAACMVHCLEKPDISHIMVSYREPNFFGIGAQFNCICAKEGALEKAEHEGDDECRVECPDDDPHVCGDKSKGFLSVYCLYDECPTDSASHRGLCEGVGNTAEVQGCVWPDVILREEVINVTDFTGARAGDCTQRCIELEGEGFALTSIHKKAGAHCECGSLDSLLHTPLTPGICQTISRLMGADMVWVTCEKSYSNDMLPSTLSGEKEMLDHVKVALNVILFLVCLILVLAVVIVVLKKYWKNNYVEMEGETFKQSPQH